MSKSEQERINELVAMLDGLVEQGTGHINIKVDDVDGNLNVETTNSTECSGGKGACSQPTELEPEED